MLSLQGRGKEEKNLGQEGGGAEKGTIPHNQDSHDNRASVSVLVRTITKLHTGENAGTTLGAHIHVPIFYFSLFLRSTNFQSGRDIQAFCS